MHASLEPPGLISLRLCNVCIAALTLYMLSVSSPYAMEHDHWHACLLRYYICQWQEKMSPYAS